MKSPHSLTVFVAGAAVNPLSSSATGFQRGVLNEVVLGRLLDRTTNADFKSGVLESVRSDSNFKVWNLRLRGGLSFHNGRAAIAEDLKFACEYLMQSRFATPESSFLKEIEHLEVTSGLELCVTLRKSVPHFFSALELASLSLIPSEELYDSGGSLNAASPFGGSHLHWKSYPIGVGPYRVLSSQENWVTLERTVYAPRSAAQSITVVTGPYDQEADCALGFDENPDPTNLKQVRLQRPWALLGLYFNFESPLSRTGEFRRAVSSALNRAQIWKLAPRMRGTSIMIPSNFNFGVREVAEKNGFDPVAAKKGFAQFASELEQKLIIPVDPKHAQAGIEPWMYEIETQLRSAGLSIEFQVRDDFLSFKMERDSPPPFRLLSFIPSVSQPSLIFQLFRAGSSWVPKLDDVDHDYESLVDEVSSSQEQSEGVLSRLSEMLQRNAYALPLFEKALGIWINPNRISSFNESMQDLSIRLDRVHVKKD